MGKLSVKANLPFSFFVSKLESTLKGKKIHSFSVRVDHWYIGCHDIIKMPRSEKI